MNTHRLFIHMLVIVILLALGATVAAAPAATRSAGALDTTFDPGTGANDAVFAVVLQPNGKVLVGGSFTTFNGVARNRVARLAADGALDAAYNPDIAGEGFAGVTSIALQPDGKAVIGGLFTQVDGVARTSIARLKADGTLDAAFNPGAGVTGGDAYLNTVRLQADGKVLIGGIFTAYDGVARNNIARLTSTGALDTTFDPGSGPDGEVAAIAVQPSDGKVLIGGWFAKVNGVSRQGIARLNANGSVDAAFAPVLNGNALAILVQPDGKIVIGGDFTTVNGVARNRIARLHANGSLDAAFNPAAGPDKGVDALARQRDGKIVIGGKFITVAGVERKRIARLSANGALDAGFDPGPGASWTVFAVTLQPDGQVLIGGAFDAVGGVALRGVARLWGDLRTHLPLLLR